MDIIQGFLIGAGLGFTFISFIVMMNIIEKAYGEFASIAIGLIVGGGLIGAFFGTI